MGSRFGQNWIVLVKGSTQVKLHFKLRQESKKCFETYYTGRNVQMSKSITNAAKNYAISEHLIKK